MGGCQRGGAEGSDGGRTSVDLECGGVEEAAVEEGLEAGLVERVGGLVDGHGGVVEAAGDVQDLTQSAGHRMCKFLGDARVSQARLAQAFHGGGTLVLPQPRARS